MINLLPQTQQKEIRAAYSNTLLVRYAILLVVALFFLLGALAITYYSLSQAAEQADIAKQQNEQKATGYASTQASAEKFRSDLATAKSLFDNEILYSKVLTRFSGLLPEGSAVDSFQLDSASFAQSITLPVRIRNQATAEALLNNFTSSPYISSASLGKISTNTSSGAYPYTVEILFTFNRSIGQ